MFFFSFRKISSWTKNHHQSSCVVTPQQNEVSERKKQTLVGSSQISSFTVNVPKFFWGEAVLASTYLINRMPSRVLNFKTPCQVLFESFRNSHMFYYSFECVPIFSICPYKSIPRNKLDPKSEKGRSVILLKNADSLFQWMLPS